MQLINIFFVKIGQDGEKNKKIQNDADKILKLAAERQEQQIKGKGNIAGNLIKVLNLVDTVAGTEIGNVKFPIELLASTVKGLGSGLKKGGLSGAVTGLLDGAAKGTLTGNADAYLAAL